MPIWRYDPDGYQEQIMRYEVRKSLALNVIISNLKIPGWKIKSKGS